jgi:hypothetical protein
MNDPPPDLLVTMCQDGGPQISICLGSYWCDECKETHFIEYPNELLD